MATPPALATATDAAGAPSHLLDVRGLTTTFATPSGAVAAVSDVSFTLDPGEVLGIVGESGCGKSATSLSVMRLITDPPGKITAGEVWFRGRDLMTVSETEMQRVRGNRIAMIFQEPMTALNPVFTIGNQIAEGVRLHQHLSRKEAHERAVSLLDQVGIPSAAQRVREYPHQLSGGMRQRAMIAMAIACDPDVLFADEPTTALDVTIQAQILALLGELRTRVGMGMVLISHDLGVIAETADRVAVMYGGRIVESAPTVELFHHPAHPYTRGLLASLPHPDTPRGQPLPTIPGTVPALGNMGTGCRFRDRCPEAIAACDGPEPALVSVAPGHTARCYLNHSIATEPVHG